MVGLGSGSTPHRYAATAAGRFDKDDRGAIIDLAIRRDPSDLMRADEIHCGQRG